MKGEARSLCSVVRFQCSSKRQKHSNAKLSINIKQFNMYHHTSMTKEALTISIASLTWPAASAQAGHRDLRFHRKRVFVGRHHSGAAANDGQLREARGRVAQQHHPARHQRLLRALAGENDGLRKIRRMKIREQLTRI